MRVGEECMGEGTEEMRGDRRKWRGEDFEFSSTYWHENGFVFIYSPGFTILYCTPDTVPAHCIPYDVLRTWSTARRVFCREYTVLRTVFAVHISLTIVHIQVV